MAAFAVSLAVLLVLGFSTWQGYRKGLILTVCGVLVIIISAFAGGRIAAAYADKAASSVAPVRSWLPDDKIEEAAAEVLKGASQLSQVTDTKTLREVARLSFEKIGITGPIIDNLVEKALDGLKSDELGIRESISYTFLYSVSYLVLCVFGFLVVFVVLTLLVNFIAAVFKFPVFNLLVVKLVDKIGGALLGLLFGVLIMCVVGWAMHFVGVFLPPDIFEASGLLKYFMNAKLLTGLLTVI
jgi:uncharacterized membrane protein required for colicin V production